MLAPISRISSKLGRNVMTNFVRNHGGPGDHGGIPGEVSDVSQSSQINIDSLDRDFKLKIESKNLPFSINNRYKLTLLFMVYVGSGLSIPYLITRHQLLKH